MTIDERLLERIRVSLTERFDGVVDAETVQRHVLDCYQAMFRTARIKTFLPVMAESLATRELQRIVAQGNRDLAPRILFLSRHDAGRSQMALALISRAALHTDNPIHAESAGAQPNGQIEPMVVTAMTEIGFDLTIDHPKFVTPQAIAAADLIVRTDDSCVVPIGKRHLDWDLPDPAHRPLTEVRQIRDDIGARVQGLLADLQMPA